jgi:hypothetical protein
MRTESQSAVLDNDNSNVGDPTPPIENFDVSVAASRGYFTIALLLYSYN